MKKTLLATFPKCPIRNFSLKAISSDQLVSFKNSQVVILKSFLFLIVLVCTNLGARAKSLSTNDIENLVANYSNTAVNIDSTISIRTGPTTLTTATVSITDNFHQGVDYLEINNTTRGTYNPFSFSDNITIGVLKLTGKGITDEYQAKLNQVAFHTFTTLNSTYTITFSLNAANWEQHNGTPWVTATSYPEETNNSCETPLVTIRVNHTLTMPPSATISIPS